MIVVAGYSALQQHGDNLTIAQILAAAGVSTRSFYRHFASKDALLCAMYRRDADYAASHLQHLVDTAASPTEAVDAWIDGIFAFLRSSRRAERVSVLRSIIANRAEGAETQAMIARDALIAPLRSAIQDGAERGSFPIARPDVVADLLAAAVLEASGLARPVAPRQIEQADVVAFCHRALGVESPLSDRQ